MNDVNSFKQGELSETPASTCLKGYVGVAALRFPGHSRGKSESKSHCEGYEML